MSANTEILTAVLAFASALGSTLGSIWLKDYLVHRHVKKNTPTPTDKSMFYLEIDKICNEIRESVKADGAYLAYFHNGGVFANGIAMDKFTVVGEDYNDLLACSNYKRQYTAMMINYITYAYHRLLVSNKYGEDNVDEVSDLTFRNDLKLRYINSVYMFLIKNPITDKPIGFFALEYINPYTMNQSDEVAVWKQQNKLSRLLNMTVLNN
jgi:hypothetical protein